ncbi:MAG: carboxypeptidase-like regulatory domain-containing protein, partial [Gaiellales bacterium]
EPGGWGFTLGDIDVDQVQITATSDGTRQLSGAQLTGNRFVRGSLSGNQVQDYVASVPYNYLGNGGPRPAWVPGAVGGQLIGNGLESDGAAGWFMPSTSVKTLTFTFTPLPGQTDPAAPQSYQLWFALRTHVVSGTVRNADTSLPVAGATLALSDPTGAVLGTVQSDQRGRYRIGNIYERSGYTLTIDPPGNLHVVGLDARSVDLSFGDKRIDFALTRNPNEPKPVPNPTPAQVKPQLTLAFAAKEVASETTTTLTATYRNRPAALGAASVSFTLPAGLSLRGSTCARVDGGVVTIDIANLQPMARSCAMTVGAARPVRTTATVDATLAVEVAPLAATEDSASVVILPAGNAPRPVTG